MAKEAIQTPKIMKKSKNIRTHSLVERGNQPQPQRAEAAIVKGQSIGEGSTFTVEEQGTNLVVTIMRPNTSLTVTHGEIVIAIMPPSITVVLTQKGEEEANG